MWYRVGNSHGSECRRQDTGTAWTTSEGKLVTRRSSTYRYAGDPDPELREGPAAGLRDSSKRGRPEKQLKRWGADRRVAGGPGRQGTCRLTCHSQALSRTRRSASQHRLAPGLLILREEGQSPGPLHNPLSVVLIGLIIHELMSLIYLLPGQELRAV